MPVFSVRKSTDSDPLIVPPRLAADGDLAGDGLALGLEATTYGQRAHHDDLATRYPVVIVVGNRGAVQSHHDGDSP